MFARVWIACLGFFVSLFSVGAFARVGVTSPDSDRPKSSGELFDAILANLHSVVGAVDGVGEDVKAQAKAGLDDVLSEVNRQELFSYSSSNLGVEDLYDLIHHEAHDVIDNLGLYGEQLRRLHSAVHHVFSSTVVGPGCYRSIAENHTGCLDDVPDPESPPSPTCLHMLEFGLSEDERSFILKQHNYIRSTVARGLRLKRAPLSGKITALDILHLYQPKAARMREMVWDEELAILAQKWANQCRDEPDCVACRTVPRFKVGQNLYAVRSKEDRPANWSFVLDAWYKAGDHFDHNFVYEYPGTSELKQEARFYSQIVWDETYLVGCGYARFKTTGGKVHHLYVCNYGPTGNIRGKPVYATGTPCSRCPYGHKCTVQALCSYGPPPAGFNPTPLSSAALFGPLSPTSPGARSSPDTAAESSSSSSCRSKCVPQTYLRFCDVETFQNGACGKDDEICCELNFGNAGGGDVVVVEEATTARPSVRKCQSQCVKVSLVSLCRQETIYFGTTHCGEQEICCEPRILGSVSVEPTEAAVSTTDRPRTVSCPFACLPLTVSSLCDETKIVAHGHCHAEDQICCGLSSDFAGPEPGGNVSRGMDRMLLPQRPGAAGTFARESCQNVSKNCVRRDLVSMLCAPGSVDDGKVCPGSNELCCSFDLRLTATLKPPEYSQSLRAYPEGGRNETSGQSAPAGLPRCEGPDTECLAKYQLSRCRKGAAMPRDFTDTFSCSSRLTCCAPLEKIKKRLLDIQIKTDLPTSLLTSTQCGVDAHTLDRVVNSGIGPLNTWCWAVALVDDKNRVICAGALIETRFVSVPASCKGKNPRSVLLPWNGKKYDIMASVPRFDFNDRTLDNDLMVVVLIDAVNLEEDKACLICLRKTSAVPDFNSCSILHNDPRGKNIGAASTSLPVSRSDHGPCINRTTGGEPMPLNAICMEVDEPLSVDQCLLTGSPIFCVDGNVSFLAGHTSFPTTCGPKLPLVVSNTYLPWVITFLGTFLQSTAILGVERAASGMRATSAAVDADGGGDLGGCGKLLDISHGKYAIVCPPNLEGTGVNENCTYDGKYAAGTQVKYTCNPYYILRGPPARVCQPTGEWSGDKPFCEVDCGKRPRFQQLSIGGNRTRTGDWPWQAALYDRETLNVVCGGALIHEFWVMTAAHCVVEDRLDDAAGDFLIADITRITVFLGKYYRDVRMDDELVAPKKVVKVVPHPRFNPQSYDADIALIKFERSAVLSPRVQIVCLPSVLGLSEANVEPSSVGTVAGWGVTEGGEQAEVLYAVELPVVSRGQCVKETNKVNRDSSFSRLLTKDMFCAGYGSSTSVHAYKSVCRGDSGGPMVFQAGGKSDVDSGSWVVEGIVSFYFGKQSCSDKRPGDFAIFTRVQPFYNWIISTMTTN